MAGCVGHVERDHLLAPVEHEIDIPEELISFLESSQVIRYRFVTIDIEFFWNLFETSRDLGNFDDVSPIKFHLFDDMVVEMKLSHVYHTYWYSYAAMVTTLPGYETDPYANIFADVSLVRDESATVDMYAAGVRYAVMPVHRGPYHVIFQFNPDEMGAID